MKTRITTMLFLTGCLLPSVTGCWVFRGPNYGEPRLPPVSFDAQPTLNDLIFAINDNTNRVRQLQTDSADVRVKGFKLKASLALQPSDDFRLRAGLTAFTGTEVDIGSNQQLMWMWTKWHPQPAVYYVYHDDFARGAARELLPVDPRFLIEALGLVKLDPSQQHDGPYQSGTNRLKIISRIPSQQGELTRVTVVDDRYGWVLEQHLQDATGRLLASARAKHHRYNETAGVSLPHDVRITLAPGTAAQLELHLQVRNYFVNQLVGDAGSLFRMPEIDGYSQVNLGGAANSQSSNASATNAMSSAELSPDWRSRQPNARRQTTGDNSMGGAPDPTPNYESSRYSQQGYTDPRNGFRPQFRGSSMR